MPHRPLVSVTRIGWVQGNCVCLSPSTWRFCEALNLKTAQELLDYMRENAVGIAIGMSWTVEEVNNAAIDLEEMLKQIHSC